MEAIQKDTGLEHENDTEQYLTFTLENEEYGVSILEVQEIRGWESATKIPNTPEYVLGVVNLRGSVVPIIDLRIRFNLKSAEYTATTVVVLVKVAHEGRERTIGVVVDAVADVYNISHEEINDTPDIGGAINSSFIKGLATVDEKMIIILDISPLIVAEILDEVEQKAEQDIGDD